MKEWKRSQNVVVLLSTFVCIVLASCDRSRSGLADAERVRRANEFLSSAQLPSLPNGATNVRSWTGGVSAKYANVKFSISPDQALEYFKGVGAEHCFEFELDAQTSEYHVTATHFLADSQDEVVEPDLFELDHRTGIAAEPWFKSVYDIHHGWYYASQEGIVGFHLYYDLDAKQFYVYWHCS